MLRHKIRKNYRVDLAFAWKNPDGTAMNLTGYTARFILRTDFAENGGTELANVASGASSSLASVTITTAASGIVDVRIKPGATTLMTGAQDYFWELQLLQSSEVVKGVRGRFETEGTI